MKSTDLRINNYLNYITLEGDITSTAIDWQDLRWISEDEMGFNLAHSPIQLTEEILLKCGFEKEKNIIPIYNKGLLSIYLECEMYPNGRIYFNSWFIIKQKPKLLHQLQNLYFALTGQELTINL